MTKNCKQMLTITWGLLNEDIRLRLGVEIEARQSLNDLVVEICVVVVVLVKVVFAV